MRLLFVLLLAVVIVFSMPSSRIRNSFSETDSHFVERLRRAVPYGGYSMFGGPSGEGSTWAGANAFGISNSDISLFGK